MPVSISLHSTIGFSQKALAQTGDSSAVVPLKPGAIEFGLAGSATIVDGSSRINPAVRTGLFESAPRGFWGIEIEMAFSHVNALNRLEWEGLFSRQRAWKKSSVYRYF